jgi:Zn-dependent M28 family amino/carboxypeptidase
LTGEIHNGADDNASGVASIIEIARAAAADRSRFPRSLVFVAFAGEERGLLGSAFYSNNPAVPIADTIAMLNLDMVGRSNGKIEVGGMDKVPVLEQDVREAALDVGLDARRSSIGAGRSDDANFLDKQIPAIHFFTGFHADYHRPGDDWNKIDAFGAARVATLALEVAARVAADSQRPAFASR